MLDEKLEPINTKLGAIEETLADHTASPDAIAKNKADLRAEMAVMRGRMSVMKVHSRA